jgi:hypothetical protein
MIVVCLCRVQGMLFAGKRMFLISAHWLFELCLLRDSNPGLSIVKIRLEDLRGAEISHAVDLFVLVFCSRLPSGSSHRAVHGIGPLSVLLFVMISSLQCRSPYLSTVKLSKFHALLFICARNNYVRMVTFLSLKIAYNSI